ncbi:hypothetical protein E5082_26385 [Streptomyces griseoluteus]|uniref:Uncharacterized protein n=1 Tax=Streptomyces griseoluteus TaxID=29306 RepID=A0A4Z1D6D2_STRGP|nr:hypothetical protein [Streptomyces griseoluteus]TGN77515.1 hypothetical protein E5082_26385 [Streptomyces griseoluteus]GHF24824.1 hypothetical protein GCM10017776_49000 [Streptomyces griseoluteus]
MNSAARLQIHSVEHEGFDTAVCVVRCTAGIARVGQEYAGPLTLDSILRHGKEVELLDPPHSAKVWLSGAGVRTLERGAVVTALPSGK